MASVVLSFFLLSFVVEDVTLPNGVRVIWSAGPAATARSRDGRVVVIVSESETARAPYGDSPRPSPLPPWLPPDAERWQVVEGPPELIIEWPAPPVEDALLLVALLDKELERRDGVLRLTVVGGWPPETRRRIDDELARLSSLSARELPALKQACVAWATPLSSGERAQRLLSVTLATGNPRLLRELSDRCARLTVGLVTAAARGLSRRARRVLVKTLP